ncbi:MAG: ATP-binding protein [Bacillota bacterium]|nr:ATP-binding protein [Bacillota bacterium]
MLSLKTKLSLYFISVALLCVILITIMANIFMEKQFKQYTISNQEQKNKNIANLINQQYSENGSWNFDGVEEIGISALQEGLVLKLTNSSGETVWNASRHNHGICKEMMDNLINNMSARYPSWDGKFLSNEYPLFYKNNRIGTVTIGFYGPFYYNENDLMFIKTLNSIIVVVGLISLIFAFALGIFISHRLSRPIQKVILTAKNIANGYYSDRINEITGINEIFQLTTEINNLARALEKHETLRKRLTSDVAHELRTPMATLQSHLEAMIDGIWDADNKNLVRCHSETIRLGKLIKGLEELARFEGDSITLTMDNYDICSQMKSVLLDFEAAFKSKNVTVFFHGNPLKIYADMDKIRQVLINLISNAVKYTPEGGKISIDVSSNSKNAKITVKDTGLGISNEDLPFIFERFYRADKSRTRTTGGAGIGLAIVKTIIDAHKGNITVKSELKKGSEFAVTLPLCQ